MAIPTTEQLRKRIAAYGNQYRLAQVSGVPRQTIQNIVMGKVGQPGLETARAILCALDELETMTVPPCDTASANH